MGGRGDGWGWERELLDLLRPGGSSVRQVVAWLADAVGGAVCLHDDTGAVVAGTELDSGPFESLLGDVVAGRIASAAWEGQGRHLRMVRLSGPAGVVTVSRTAPFERRDSEIVARTVQGLELLLRARQGTESERRLERATSDLRLAILQLLMVEDTVSARRVAAGLWPGLLDTDTACVYVVESGPEERDRLAEECLHATAEQALVVRCPAMDGHVIVVTPREGVAGALRSLIGSRPRVFLGGSARQSLARTATAYGQAVSALAVAHFRPDQAAVYAERTHPERLISPAALHGWAARVLGPFDGLPHHTRAELLATTRLGLEFTAVSAAKVLGVSRNTVRARMERAETLLGTDFTDLTARAVVHLALSAHESAAHDPDRAPGPTSADAEDADLFAGPALRSWAHDLLARLDTDSRDLRRTVRTWIAAGGNAERAAQTLGFHAQTVREHVRAAEPVLERRLLAGGGDLYEVVLAHLASGDLAQPALRGADQDESDSLVHR
ncbi:helix-turn-helix domain-containing protein [Streptomyces sp. GXMU-J15]|uniref:Helix-turn-helix domain-containing protein n=1 Tax=Streptomyces fuscus TaxID=3048495 RepID=A0ABT7J0W8_9ACTN|nr:MULTISPECIES: helix-turn-helix domain-containing protein [Streptomyces]MDL2078440.1 helix-turn-helix domain-containing protein [Streptomyces fuscus]SBT93756.1 PucR C-terminal helix-turn-helix domain-containing protein [Streptomyces sp. DI166]